MSQDNQKPIAHLYSFRRCPYAMRARMTLCMLTLTIEIRDISLKNKPQSMLQASPKGTVPVLVLPSGQIIDESIDIMRWATQQYSKQNLLPSTPEAQAVIDSWVTENDKYFKPQLDRFKYPQRFNNVDVNDAQKQCLHFFEKINTILQNQPYLLGAAPSLADIAVFPFIRQASRVDEAWFQTLPLPHLNQWLTHWLTHPCFLRIMQKFPLWAPESSPHFL